MRRFFADLWALVATLGLAAAIVIRWRKGQVAMVPDAAAPAIRLLALVIVFAQGCADKLRRKDEPAGQGAAPGAGEEQGEEQGAGEGGDADGDMSQSLGSNGPGEEDMSQAAIEDGEFPLRDEDEVARCVRLLADQGWATSNYKRFARRLATVAEGTGPSDPVWEELLRLLEATRERGFAQAAAEAFEARFRAHLEARRYGRSETIAAFEALLLAAEALPLFDAWLAGYVWRQAAPLAASGPARARLLARVERHLRVRQALLKGEAEAGPVEFVPWRSKAAPPADWRGVTIPPGLLPAARRAYASADTGTWETAGTIALTIRSEGVMLVRRGRARPIEVGQTITLRRLDLLHARRAARLHHAELGDMSIGAGESAWAWNLGARLGAEGRAQVRARVAAAQAGDASALKQLEAILPAAHQEIRAAVAARPEAPGSAGLRMLLALFDE